MWGARKHAGCVAALPLIIGGCTGNDPDGQLGDILGTLRLTGPAPMVADEGNDSFASAKVLEENEFGPTVIRGDIETDSDIDVYLLDGAPVGTHIRVDVSGVGYLDPAAAVFDADQNLLYLNDDRNFFAGIRDARVNFVLRRDTDALYVAIASSPSGSSTGEYTLSVSVNAGTSATSSPQSQHVLLNFDGASAIGFGGRAPVDIPPFEATNVSLSLNGQTDALIDGIVERVLADYAGLDVIFYTYESDIPRGVSYSTVHFGAYDRALLGVAENIDEFNEIIVQDAIVFTDTFSVFEVLQPTVDEYAQALANVTSHEVGHLLGLVHTADITGVMDVSASLRQLTLDQAFKQSPLDPGTFPLGMQDAAVTLVESVGGDLEMVRASSDAQLLAPEPLIAGFDAKRNDSADFPRVQFSTCMCRSCEAGKAKSVELQSSPLWPVD